LSLEAFAVSAGAVALGEIGDKTQLMAVLMAARYRRPGTIIAGILAATLITHSAAGALGAGLNALLDPQWLRWGLGLGFIAVAVWMLVPEDDDDDDDDEAPPARSRSTWGLFGLTMLMFIAAEVGDKSQVATLMLAARFESLLAVIAGATLGEMLAIVPAVLLGQGVLKRVPVRWLHRIAAAVFAALGLAVLSGLGSG
jgi:putative Ca2+/H+ antiporter (TMEM165/GDT1 family)